ncbi:MAG TPA: septal ring lytic transglycosylase RlpA family protein [Gammaproteobacteria bacterium]|nr:septal ring lytic transglycosylase RlpA family protein [Gammaproteobacteria bacterium]
MKERLTPIIICLSLLLAACASDGPKKSYTAAKSTQDSAPEDPPDLRDVPDAKPKHEAKSRYGNPKSYEVFGKRYYTKESSHGYVAHGQASWYGTKFHGNRTSSGETYDMYDMTAAHVSLPLPTYARVTNTKNGKSVVVKINDRGPFHDDRIIDLSYAAAARIGILQQGTGHVKVEAIDPHHHYKEPNLIMASNDAPAKAPIPTAAAAKAQKNNDPEQFYLQIAAFGEKSYAENMVKQLETVIEQPLRISQANKDAFYRVQVGPFEDEDTAKHYQAQLADLILEKPVVVTQ